MDDIKARKQVVAKGQEHGQKMEPLWTLEVLDEAAERGFIEDLAEKLDHLEHRTPFYVGERARAVIEAMKQRDRERKQSKKHEPMTPEPPTEPTQERTPEPKPSREHRRGRPRER